MSDETVIDEEAAEEEAEGSEEAEGGQQSTEDLASYDEIHAQAAANRRAMAPYGDDPTVVTAGTDGIAPPGPGPEEEGDAEAAEATTESADEEVEGDEEAYDPGLYTVAEVNEYIAAHPEE